MTDRARITARPTRSAAVLLVALVTALASLLVGPLANTPADAGAAAEPPGKPVTVMHPEKRLYTVQNMPMTEAAIDPGLMRDLYASLGDPIEGGYWLVKVQVKPFIDWIWGGCIIMALGGFLAAMDRRYRVAVPVKKTTVEATARLEGDWAADVAIYDDIEHHILHMSDALSEGIAAQLPHEDH